LGAKTLNLFKFYIYDKINLSGMKGKVIEDDPVPGESLVGDSEEQKSTAATEEQSAGVKAQSGDQTEQTTPIEDEQLVEKGDRRVSFDLRPSEPVETSPRVKDSADELAMTDVFPVDETVQPRFVIISFLCQLFANCASGPN